MSDANAVLDSVAYTDAIEEIKRQTGIRVYPDYPKPLRDLDAKNVDLAGADVEVLRQALESDRNSLIRFAVEKLRKFDGVVATQEYPKGEVPGPGDRDVQIGAQGYAKGFLLLSLLEYVTMRDRPDSLTGFLKARRLPHAKQYATDLRTLYENARATTLN